jgi:hypothetical protein
VFDTGSLAPSVTVETVDYRILSLDAGLKYRGFFFQTELSSFLLAFHAGRPRRHPSILINALLPGPIDTARYYEGGLDPTQARAPEVVYPHTRFLVLLPPGGPHDRVFWNSQEYKMHDPSNVTPTHGHS